MKSIGFFAIANAAPIFGHIDWMRARDAGRPRAATSVARYFARWDLRSGGVTAEATFVKPFTGLLAS